MSSSFFLSFWFSCRKGSSTMQNVIGPISIYGSCSFNYIRHFSVLFLVGQPIITRIPLKTMSLLGRSMCHWHIIATVIAYEFLFFAYPLIILYIYTKICKNVSKCFRVIEQTQSASWNLPRGHNYVKTISRTVQTFSDDPLYLYQVSRKYLQGFQSY